MFFDDHIDLTKHELRNAVIQNAAADPATPLAGQVYYHSGSNRPRIYDGTSFKAFLLVGDVSGASGDVTQATNSAGAGQMKVSAGANKSIIDYSGGAGIVKSDGSGVVTPAVAGTDYLTAGSTNTLTNKTFDANGTGNTISNLETADFAAGVINTSTSLTGATNAQIPSALAIKTYADNLLSANDAMVFKGVIDCSANPNYPAANAGETYKVSVAGLIGGGAGVPVQVNDMLVCSVDATSAGNHATVGANWYIVQSNLEAASTTVSGYTRYATGAEARAQDIATAALTPDSVKSFAQENLFTFGDGAALTYILTHNLNNKDVVVQVRDATTDEVRFPKIVTTLNTVVISGYLVAPATNAMKAVILGSQK